MSGHRARALAGAAEEDRRAGEEGGRAGRLWIGLLVLQCHEQSVPPAGWLARTRFPRRTMLQADRRAAAAEV